jgi:hypothetical protein
MYTMPENFCTKTARKIRKLGYARAVAIFYARFFYSVMLLVCAVMDILCVPPENMFANAGFGKSPAGARAGIPVPAFSGIR